MSAFQAEDTGPIPVTGSIVSGADPGSSACAVIGIERGSNPRETNLAK